MTTFSVTIQSMEYIPAASHLSSELARHLDNPQDGIELTHLEQLALYNTQLNLFLTVEAASGAEARARALEWIDAACRDASEWREESEVVFDDEVDDEHEGETYEIGQFFAVTGVVDASSGEDVTHT